MHAQDEKGSQEYAAVGGLTDGPAGQERTGLTPSHSPEVGTWRTCEM